MPNNSRVLKKKYRDSQAQIQTPQTREFAAFLGNSSGIVQQDDEGHVYVILQTGVVLIVHNEVVPLIPRLPVICGYTADKPKLLQVLRARDVYVGSPLPVLPNHGTLHTWPKLDTTYVAAQQILPGLAFGGSAVSLRMVGFIYYLDGWKSVSNYDEDNEIDLSSYIPTVGANWLLLEIDSSGVISYTAGAVVGSRLSLTIADIPEPTPGKKPLVAVKVYAGQTEIINTATDTDIADIRFGGFASGGGVPLLDPNRVVFTDDDGVLATGSFWYNRYNVDYLGQSYHGFDTPRVSGNNAEVQTNHDESTTKTVIVLSDNIAHFPGFVSIRGGWDGADPTKVLDGMLLNTFRGAGFYHEAGDPAAQGNSTAVINLIATGDWDATSRPAEIWFYTTPVGGTTRQLRGRFTDGGDLDLEPGGQFTIGGVPLPTGTVWGDITGTISDQTDLWFALNNIDLTTQVTGVLPPANGGTGVSNAGTIDNDTNLTIDGGGTINLGGFSLTIPATLTAAGLGIANVFTRGQFIDGSADEIQLRVQGHSSQTTSLITVENSVGTVVAGVDSSGRLFSYGKAAITSDLFMQGAGNITLTGTNTIGIGSTAFAALTSGSENVGIGSGVLNALLTGNNNVAIGYLASRKELGSSNTAVGSNAGGSGTNHTSSFSTYIGQGAGLNARADSNTFLGAQTGATKTTGARNVLIGAFTGFNQTTGSDILLIDARDSQRASAAAELTDSIIYGVMGTTPDVQALTINAAIIMASSKQKASAAGAVWDSINQTAATVTVSGSTNITTATGFNYHTIARPTISAASALTVTNSATLYIANSPLGAGAGPATITNAYAIWVDDGNVRFDGFLGVGASPSANASLTVRKTSAGASNIAIDSRLTVSTNSSGTTGLYSAITPTVTQTGSGSGAPTAIQAAVSATLVGGGSSELISLASVLSMDNGVAITNWYGLRVFNPINGGIPGVLTNSYGVYVEDQSIGTTLNYAIYTNIGKVSFIGSQSIASGASAVWNGVELRAATATITGSTNITTATGFNYHTIARPTLSAASALTITNAATLYIANSPLGAGAGPATITNAYAIWVDDGTVRLDGKVTTLGSATIASAAGAIWDAVEFRAATATLSGNTNITTATGFNYQTIAAPTITSPLAVTITNAATLYIAGAPAGAGAGPATITNAYSLWIYAGVSRFDGNFDLSNAAVNFVLDSTTGTKWGTATSQKQSFWNATPIVQPTTAIAAATFVANTSGIVNDTATFDGYTVGQIVKALRNLGLLA